MLPELERLAGLVGSPVNALTDRCTSAALISEVNCCRIAPVALAVEPSPTGPRSSTSTSRVTHAGQVVGDRDADDAGAYDDHPVTASQNAHDGQDL